MDSLTQIALGAAVGYACLGKKLGRRSLVWGAACGTLPDLDVLIPMGDPIADFTYHRGFSHSILVLTILSPITAWFMKTIHPELRDRSGFLLSMLLAFLAYITHILIDSFTVYGTQIFWPLEVPPASWSTLFIIDPLYTLPLLLGCIAAIFLHKKGSLPTRFNQLGLIVSTLYLCWSITAKFYAESQVKQSLDRQGISYDKLLSTAAPFNTILWRLVARKEGGYYEIFYSLLDSKEREVDLQFFNSEDQLLEQLEEIPGVKRLQWFTHGFYKVYFEGNDVLFSDLRMGSEPSYIFTFKIAQLESVSENGLSILKRVPPEQVPTRPDISQIGELFERIKGLD